jgi:hypothetical protein
MVSASAVALKSLATLEKPSFSACAAKQRYFLLACDSPANAVARFSFVFIGLFLLYVYFFI